jgi:hypothetical protein
LRKIALRSSIFCVVTAIGAILPMSVATAAPSDASGSDVTNSTLSFGGYDASRAARNGYDVRTDAEGWQYAVPTGTPRGSLVGATPKYNPQTGQTKSINKSGFHALNTVSDKCGTSTLTLYTRTSGYTSYNLIGAYGASISHTWKISLSAKTGNQIVDRSGLPTVPGITLNWGTNFSYGVKATAKTTVHGVVSTGIVETTLGTCYTDHPTDTLEP